MERDNTPHGKRMGLSREGGYQTGGSQPIMLFLTASDLIAAVMREQKREQRLLPVKTPIKSLTFGGESVRITIGDDIS